MICPKCNQQYDIYNAIVAEDGENKGKWICPECKVPLHYSDAGIPPITIDGIKVSIDDVEQVLEDKSKETIRSKIKQTIINTIGEDRPFMDVEDIAEEITQTVVEIMAQDAQGVCEYCGTPENSPNYAYHICIPTKKKVVLSIIGGVIDAVDIPPGIVVKVCDYDIESYYENELTHDSDGNLCCELVFEDSNCVGDDDKGDQS